MHTVLTTPEGQEAMLQKIQEFTEEKQGKIVVVADVL